MSRLTLVFTIHTVITKVKTEAFTKVKFFMNVKINLACVKNE